MHNSRPGFIQRLVPDTAREHLDIKILRPSANEPRAFLVNAVAVLVLHEIHLVDEAEDVGGRTEFFEGFNDGTVGVEVLLDFARLNVEDVD